MVKFSSSPCYNVLMDNFEYLQKISESNRPVKKPSKFSQINGSLILKILIGGILASAILIVIGIVINTGPARATDVAQQLYLRMNNVNKVISTYNKNLKSSQLRSINYSLSGTLTNTAPQLSSYITTTNSGSKSPLTPPNDILAYETSMDASVNGALATAKLNGTLDRIYSSQIHLQVSLMLSLTGELLERDKDPALQTILDPFYSNLNVIEQSLNNYSDTSR